MVWKTALVKIPFGGGKSGIRIDGAALSAFERADMVREFVHLIESDLVNGVYIPAPDLGSRPADMATIYGQTHILSSVTGKPPRLGGLPGRKEATGRGVAHSVALGLERVFKRPVKGATVAVQGFGNVGSWAAKFLRDMGATVVAVSDHTGGWFNPKGVEIDPVMKCTSVTGCLGPEKVGDRITNAELLALDVDVLAPCAVEKVITDATAPTVRAKLVVEGANGPTTEEGDAILEKKGIVAIPDFLANAGGVIASYIEWRSAKSGSITDKREVFESIDKVIDAAFTEVESVAKEKKISHRRAAECVAVNEVVGAMQDRGWI
jgi:glutamate dehydrogenase (NAD(P)+)